MSTDRTDRAVQLLTAGALVLLVGARAEAKGKTVTLTIGPFPIEAKRDREVCRAVRVPSVPGMEILGSEVRSRSFRHGAVGTHHFIAYGYRGAHSADFPSPSTLADDPGCNGFGPTDFFSNRVSIAASGGESRKGNWLVTSVLKPGLHTFTVRALTADNQVALDKFQARVTAPRRPPAKLAGSWSRAGHTLWIAKNGWVIGPNHAPPTRTSGRSAR